MYHCSYWVTVTKTANPQTMMTSYSKINSQLPVSMYLRWAVMILASGFFELRTSLYYHLFPCPSPTPISQQRFLIVCLFSGRLFSNDDKQLSLVIEHVHYHFSKIWEGKILLSSFYGSAVVNRLGGLLA